MRVFTTRMMAAAIVLCLCHRLTFSFVISKSFFVYFFVNKLRLTTTSHPTYPINSINHIFLKKRALYCPNPIFWLNVL